MRKFILSAFLFAACDRALPVAELPDAGEQADAARAPDLAHCGGAGERCCERDCAGGRCDDGCAAGLLCGALFKVCWPPSPDFSDAVDGGSED